jgi:predicted acyl esterase
MTKLLVLVASVTAATLPTAATAVPPEPFGHDCVPRSNTLFCPTSSDAERVRSFDGVPIDVDVTLPANADGPFPAIALLHGWGGDKTDVQAESPQGRGGTDYHFNNVFFAQRGYAVITATARGFGRSCGIADSRGAAGCARAWARFSDQRYEIRDIQHMLGLLVDQAVVRPRAIGVAGISYGGIESMILARLRDRVRLRNGRFRPWRSPRGRHLHIAAANPRWGAWDLTSALQPNGRYLDFGADAAEQSIRPGGVSKEIYNDILYLAGGLSGFYSPRGGPLSADITGWKAMTDRGEPVRGAALAVGRELTEYHSAAGLSGASAPMLVMNGWTDDLFPAPEAVRAYRRSARRPGGYVALQLADLGHPRGSNKLAVDRYLNAQGARFFDAFLRDRGSAPRNRSVTAFTQTCPARAPAEGPYRAPTWDRLHPHELAMSRRPGQTISSSGGDPALAVSPAENGACGVFAARQAPGTAVVSRRVGRPFTLLGLPTVRAVVRTRGSGGFIAARLWDVRRQEQTLVSRGVYRLRDDQRGRIVFQLFGNGWRFEPGHRVKLELLGNDPGFLRTSNFNFSVRVARLSVELPGR